MLNMKRLLLLISVSTLILFSCNKEEPEPEPTPTSPTNFVFSKCFTANSSGYIQIDNEPGFYYLYGCNTPDMTGVSHTFTTNTVTHVKFYDGATTKWEGDITFDVSSNISDISNVTTGTVSDISLSTCYVTIETVHFDI